MEVRTQTELKDELELRLQDTANNIWSEAQFYAGINAALNYMGNNVKIPFLYTLADGFSSNSKEYTLPYYIGDPVDPQIRIGSNDWWADLPSYQVVSGSGGVNTLLLGTYPASNDGRIIHWNPNSVVPTTIPTMSGSIDADDTSCTVSTTLPVGQNGYIKIDNEWIQYSGAVRTTSTVLSNLVRGCLGTTAASHSSSPTVNWGVVVHRPDIFEFMMDYGVSFMHLLRLTKGSSTEAERHQWMVRWFDPKAEMFWKRYVPWRQPKMILSRAAMGDVYAPGLSRNVWAQGDTYNLW
jgi:hypothetical protein